MTEEQNIEAVKDFWNKGWLCGDLNYILSFLSGDVKFIPAPPVEAIVGFEKCKEIIEYLLNNLIEFSLEFGNIACSNNIVFMERFEHSRNHSNNEMRDYDVVGMFVFDKQGKICLWKDYCDTPTCAD